MSLRGLYVLSVSLFIGCQHEISVTHDGVPPPSIATNFDRLPTILAGIPKTGGVRLYEGLPSEFWEPELLLRELAQAKTIRLHGYPLYEEPLELQGADSEQLTELFAARTSFAKYSDGKKGGGFQADYALEWKTPEGTTHAIIGLEIGEVKLYGPKSELHCDLSPDAAKKLRELLSRYRKNRPVETPSS